MTQAENTTTSDVQSTQQQAEPAKTQAVNTASEQQGTQLSALERAKLNDTRTTIVLDAEHLYQEFEQFGDAPRQYKAGGAVEGDFWMYRFRGTIVTVSPIFKEALDKGSILNVIATPTVGERTVADPNNAGKTMQQIVHGYSITFSGIESMQKALNAKKLASNLRVQMGVQEKMEEARVEKAIARLTPEKMKELIKDEEIDALIKAAW